MDGTDACRKVMFVCLCTAVECTEDDVLNTMTEDKQSKRLTVCEVNNVLINADKLDEIINYYRVHHHAVVMSTHPTWSKRILPEFPFKWCHIFKEHAQG